MHEAPDAIHRDKSTLRPSAGDSSGEVSGLIYRARCARCGQHMVPVRGPGRPAALCPSCDVAVVDLADTPRPAYHWRCVVCRGRLERRTALTCGRVCRQRLASARRRVAG